MSLSGHDRGLGLVAIGFDRGRIGQSRKEAIDKMHDCLDRPNGVSPSGVPR